MKLYSGVVGRARQEAEAFSPSTLAGEDVWGCVDLGLSLTPPFPRQSSRGRVHAKVL